MLRGFRNENIRQALNWESRCPEQRRKASAREGRCQKRLQVHGLIAKIPRSRRWRVVARGQRVISAFLKLHLDEYPQALAG